MTIQALPPVLQKNIAAVPKSWDTQKVRIRKDEIRKLGLVNHQAKALHTGIELKMSGFSHLIKCFKSEGCIGFNT